ncbi:MAG: T9SS type A sorting domain-containing protein [Patescibacteria group bacterium]
MKRILISFVIAVSLLFLVIPETLAQGMPVKVWETSIDSAPKQLLSMVIDGNNYVAVTDNSSENNQKTITVFQNDGVKKWVKNSADSSLYTMTPRNAVAVNNGSGFLMAIKNIVSQYDSQGEVVRQITVPTNFTGGLNITKNNDFYFIGDRISFQDHSGNSTVFMYDMNFNLIRSFPVKFSGGNVWAVDDNFLYVAANDYGGGEISNVSSDLVKYDLLGNVVWSTHFPDQHSDQVCLSGGYVYYAAIQLHLDFPGMTWNIRKFDLEGNQIWSVDWNGDYPPNNLVTMSVRDIINLPTGGCIVVGASTRPDQDMTSPEYDCNSLNPVAIAFNDSGQIIWKNKVPDPNIGSFRAVAWDKENYLILGGYTSVGGNKIWKYEIDGITGIDDNPSPVPPNNFSLSQNYPNPFNPTTTINFSLSKSGHTSLKVYDIIGREIATLIDEFIQAGTHSFKFNAGNLPSGVYLYKLSSDHSTLVQKMVICK